MIHADLDSGYIQKGMEINVDANTGVEFMKSEETNVLVADIMKEKQAGDHHE
jgi:hypothetical protein